MEIFMNINEKYECVGRRAIQRNTKISNYESNLGYRKSYIDNILSSQTMLSKMLHPIKLHRTKAEKERINEIDKEFQKIKKKAVNEFVVPFTGNKETDFCYAAVHMKPDRLTIFMSENPINSPKTRKLLKIKRKQ